MDVSIIVAGPRRLITSVKSPGLSCSCPNLHAPDADGHSQQAIQAWWGETTYPCLPIIGRRDVVVCNVDTNLRVTRSIDGVVGDLLDTTCADTPQEVLIDFCARFGLYVANTFCEIVDSRYDSGT